MVIPALALGFNKDEEMHKYEFVGLLVTVIAYMFESLADKQKLAF